MADQHSSSAAQYWLLLEQAGHVNTDTDILILLQRMYSICTHLLISKASLASGNTTQHHNVCQLQAATDRQTDTSLRAAPLCSVLQQQPKNKQSHKLWQALQACPHHLMITCCIAS